MKILKLGQKVVECDFCNSILGYEKTDIHTNEVYTAPRISNLEYYLICPVCSNHIVLEDKKCATQV
jgi:hypothetical protein